MSQSVRIKYINLVQKISSRLQAAGVDADNATLEARIMSEADAQEVPSHGVRMLPPLLKAIAEGRVTPNPNIKIEKELGAICILDCDNGPGRQTANTAMNEAIERAKKFGVGVCLAKRTTHWGRAHAYASHAAQAGFIGICTTNAIPTMAIWGAKKPVIGNNPLAIGIPLGDDKPIVLDMAMSQAAVGKVNTWLREGKTVPGNWGIDAQGNPSSNAKDILSGAVLPMGEHKGAGLALMMELLTAALAGAAFTQQLFANDNSGIDPDSTKLFVALNVNAFIEPHQFYKNVKNFLLYLQQEAAPFHYPGERGWQAGSENKRIGIPIHTEILTQLKTVGIYF